MSKAPGLRTALGLAYDEFAESDAKLAAARADIREREAALTAKAAALQERKAKVMRQIEEQKQQHGENNPPPPPLPPASAAPTLPSVPPPPPTAPLPPPPPPTSAMHHRDGRANAAPQLPLAEMLAAKAALAPTGVDRTQTGGVKVVDDGSGSSVSYSGFMGMQTDTDEHAMLSALYNEHGGDLEMLAAAAPAQYQLSLSKLKRRHPVSAKQFAFRVVEGDYGFESEDISAGGSRAREAAALEVQ